MLVKELSKSNGNSKAGKLVIANHLAYYTGKKLEIQTTFVVTLPATTMQSNIYQFNEVTAVTAQRTLPGVGTQRERIPQPNIDGPGVVNLIWRQVQSVQELRCRRCSVRKSSPKSHNPITDHKVSQFLLLLGMTTLTRTQLAFNEVKTTSSSQMRTSILKTFGSGQLQGIVSPLGASRCTR